MRRYEWLSAVLVGALLALAGTAARAESLVDRSDTNLVSSKRLMESQIAQIDRTLERLDQELKGNERKTIRDVKRHDDLLEQLGRKRQALEEKIFEIETELGRRQLESLSNREDIERIQAENQAREKAERPPEPQQVERAPTPELDRMLDEFETGTDADGSISGWLLTRTMPEIFGALALLLAGLFVLRRAF